MLLSESSGDALQVPTLCLCNMTQDKEDCNIELVPVISLCMEKGRQQYVGLCNCLDRLNSEEVEGTAEHLDYHDYWLFDTFAAVFGGNGEFSGISWHFSQAVMTSIQTLSFLPKIQIMGTSWVDGRGQDRSESGGGGGGQQTWRRWSGQARGQARSRARSFKTITQRMSEAVYSCHLIKVEKGLSCNYKILLLYLK